jgi:hypothetical protein
MHNTFHFSCYSKSNAGSEGIMSLFLTMIQQLPCHSTISIMHIKLDGYKNLVFMQPSSLMQRPLDTSVLIPLPCKVSQDMVLQIHPDDGSQMDHLKGEGQLFHHPQQPPSLWGPEHCGGQLSQQVTLHQTGYLHTLRSVTRKSHISSHLLMTNIMSVPQHQQ